LEPANASAILQKLPVELQGDVSGCIAILDRVSPEVTREIEKVLEKKLGTLSTENYSTTCGVESIVKILNHADSDSNKKNIKILEDKAPELAYAIGKLTSLLKTARR